MGRTNYQILGIIEHLGHSTLGIAVKSWQWEHMGPAWIANQKNCASVFWNLLTGLWIFHVTLCSIIDNHTKTSKYHWTNMESLMVLMMVYMNSSCPGHVSLHSQNKNHNFFSVIGLKTRHATYSWTLNHKHFVEPAISQFRNKIPAKISTYTAGLSKFMSRQMLWNQPKVHRLNDIHWPYCQG